MASVLGPLDPGDPVRVGGYELHARLGAGGMGRVYLGFSPAGRAVAVKVIHPQIAHDHAFRGRFRREVEAVRVVSGAFTAPVIGAGPDDDPPWLATAFVPGPSLADAVVDHGPLSEASTWRLAAGLVEALEAIHAAGIVHRDLKPANVLLISDGPRVIDFGISRALEATKVTETGSTLGTPGFMSPEQALDEPLGPATDVFSLGCVLVFAVTGTPPFGSGNPLGLLYRVVHASPVVDGLSGPLRDMVAACLAKEPAGRPSLSQLAGMVKAGTPADAVASVGSFWPKELTSLLLSYQPGLRVLPGDAAEATRAPHATTEPSALMDAVATPPLAPVGTGPSVPPLPAALTKPPSPRSAGSRPGLTRRRVLAVAGTSGVVAAGAGLAAWALGGGPVSPRPSPRKNTTHGTITSPKPGTKLWSFAVGAGHVRSVAAGNGRVYLADTNPAAASDAHDVYGLDAATGTQLWKVENLGTRYTGVSLMDEWVYFGTDRGYVYALTGASGEIYWRSVSLGAAVDATPAPSLGFIYAASDDGYLYVLGMVDGVPSRTFHAGGAIRSGPVPSGSLDRTSLPAWVDFGCDDGYVYRYSVLDGNAVWKHRTGGPVRQSPAVAPDGSTVYAASDDGNVYSLSGADGSVNWQFRVTTGPPVSPVLAGSTLYVGDADNTLYALDAASGTQMWLFAASGSANWRPTVFNGVVYAGAENGFVYAINGADGSQLWSYLTGGPVNSVPQVLNGIVYVGSDDGRLYALHM